MSLISKAAPRLTLGSSSIAYYRDKKSMPSSRLLPGFALELTCIDVDADDIGTVIYDRSIYIYIYMLFLSL